MFLLDTNVVFELRKAPAGRADANVVAWARSVAASSLYLSSLSVYELELGILGKERQDLRQGTILRKWLNAHVLPAFAGRILPLDLEVALRSAALNVPYRVSERDGFIAATALVHRMTVVTRNTADFRRTGVAPLDPWSAAAG